MRSMGCRPPETPGVHSTPECISDIPHHHLQELAQTTRRLTGTGYGTMSAVVVPGRAPAVGGLPFLELGDRRRPLSAASSAGSMRRRAPPRN
jgi:hypothetical protein